MEIGESVVNLFVKDGPTTRQLVVMPHGYLCVKCVHTLLKRAVAADTEDPEK